jgi:hypothetical protein
MLRGSSFGKIAGALSANFVSVGITLTLKPISLTRFQTILNAHRIESNIVLLTLLGGGAFGNESDWIIGAMRRAFGVVSSFDIDARIVSYGAPSREIIELAGEFA